MPTRVLDAGWAEALCAAMAQPARAHYFRFALDDPSPQARRLEPPSPGAAAGWPCPMATRACFLSRALYDAVGGLRPLPLMEDVDLIRRLGRARLAPLPARAITSAERWRRGGLVAALGAQPD
jgi:hypothetical protein